jgi:hypothetical protein
MQHGKAKFLRTAPAVALVLAMLVLAGACGATAPADSGGADPLQLDIPAFGYFPQSPLHLGETLKLTARILEPQLLSSEVFITGESNYDLLLTLRDDGVAPDFMAGDKVFTAAVVWEPGLGTGIVAVSLSVHALRGEKEVEDKRLAPWLHIEP